jgi:hypothetical protein
MSKINDLVIEELNMQDQIIAFLVKYQKMRQLKNEYQKNYNKFTIGKVMKLEIELDKEAEQILAALQLP